MTTVHKVAVSIPTDLYADLEAALAHGLADGNRSRAVADALRDHLTKWRNNQLTQAARQLDPRAEQDLATTSFGARRPTRRGRG